MTGALIFAGAAGAAITAPVPPSQANCKIRVREPHAVTSPSEAIETAFATYSTAYNESPEMIGIWDQIYAPKLDGKAWVLTPNMPGERPGKGTHIRLDAGTGCILSLQSVE